MATEEFRDLDLARRPGRRRRSSWRETPGVTQPRLRALPVGGQVPATRGSENENVAPWPSGLSTRRALRAPRRDP